jgi:hypothetical protein
VTTIAESELEGSHIGERPTWDCGACTKPWPCANAKNRLIAEFQGLPSVLAIYMSALMCEALIDLTAHGAEAPPDLHDRFLSWISVASTKPRASRAFPPGQSSHFQADRDRKPADRSYYNPRTREARDIQ